MCWESCIELNTFFIDLRSKFFKFLIHVIFYVLHLIFIYYFELLDLLIFASLGCRHIIFHTIKFFGFCLKFEHKCLYLSFHLENFLYVLFTLFMQLLLEPWACFNYYVFYFGVFFCNLIGNKFICKLLTMSFRRWSFLLLKCLHYTIMHQLLFFFTCFWIL